MFLFYIGLCFFFFVQAFSGDCFAGGRSRPQKDSLDRVWLKLLRKLQYCIQTDSSPLLSSMKI